MSTRQAKFDRLLALHEGPDTFVVPNPWDAGSARLLTSLGFQALATTSAGYAFARGKRDSLETLGRAEILDNAAEIAAATDLPVTADLQDGFGADPETCAETVRLAAAAGVVGGSIEDTTGDPDSPVYELAQAVDRIAAAAEAAGTMPFLLTARAENFLFGRTNLNETIERLQAFSDAGASVLYAPGLPDIAAIRAVCQAVDRPVNVVMGLRGPVYSVEELAEAGVRRISVGGSFARAALGGLVRAATEVRDSGTFNYVGSALPGEDIARVMSEAPVPNRR